MKIDAAGLASSLRVVGRRQPKLGPRAACERLPPSGLRHGAHLLCMTRPGPGFQGGGGGKSIVSAELALDDTQRPEEDEKKCNANILFGYFNL